MLSLQIGNSSRLKDKGDNDKRLDNYKKEEKINDTTLKYAKQVLDQVELTIGVLKEAKNYCWFG